jgi:ankyrin repeat protein
MDKREFLKMAVFAPFGFIQEKAPALPADLVKDFVIAGHGNLQKVKDLLSQQAGLLNASWDWGNGDFETALEGAGHVGNREIAEFLLSRGARMNVFAAAMLGRIDIVKATLTAFPDLKTSKGPHGLMLLHHATKGGSVEMLEYLKEIGAS